MPAKKKVKQKLNFLSFQEIIMNLQKFWGKNTRKGTIQRLVKENVRKSPNMKKESQPKSSGRGNTQGGKIITRFCRVSLSAR